MTKDSMFSLKGKVAIVTGGARGIGKTVARHMAMMGADIAIIDIKEDLAYETTASISKEYNVKTKAYICDVTKIKEVEDAVQKIESDFNSIDILFNNAGVGKNKPAIEITPEEWQTVIDLNINGVFYMAAAFAKNLIKHNKAGSIINTASMSASIVNIPQKQAVYNASKAAVVHLTKSLAVEWAPYNIRVNCISPGYIFTEMTANVRKEYTDFWEAATPFKRMGKPEELSGAVIYLASDCASFTSGCEIIIDGCFTCV